MALYARIYAMYSGRVTGRGVRVAEWSNGRRDLERYLPTIKDKGLCPLYLILLPCHPAILPSVLGFPTLLLIAVQKPRTMRCPFSSLRSSRNASSVGIKSQELAQLSAVLSTEYES